MAEFVATAVANAALAIGANAGTALVVAQFVVDYGLIVGGLALSASQAKKAKRKARDQYNSQQVDRLVNSSSTVTPRALLLGRVRVGGSVFFKASTGTNKTTFVQCIALAAHEVDAVEAYYLNDQQVSVDGSGNVLDAPWALTRTESAWATGTGSAQNLPYTPIAGTVRCFTGTAGGPEGDIAEVGASGSAVSGTGTEITTTAGATIQYQYTAYTYNANIRLVSGTDSQAADSRLQALFPGVWTSDHRARGVAYLICEFQYNETSFPTGLPLVTALVRGAKVYDPRSNLCAWSEAFDDASWTAITTKVVSANTTVAPDGTTTADTLTDNSAVAYLGVRKTRTVANDSASHCFSISVLKTTGGTAPTFGINIGFGGGTSVTDKVRLNTDTGEALTATNPATVVSDGAYWRVSIYITNNSSGNVSITVDLYAATSAYGGGLSDVVTATGSQVIWGAQWSPGTSPLPYVRTGASEISPVTAWSDNPALLMRHVYQHAAFGKATVSATEDLRFGAAANACDLSTGYVVSGVTTTSALYRAALAAQFGTPARDVLDDLAQAMAGSWAFAGGELYLKPGVWAGSVLSLTEADLAVVSRSGAAEQMVPIEISVHRERAGKFNSVNLQIWDNQQDYKQVALTPVTDTALVTRDAATLVQDVTLAAVGYAPQAQHVAGIMLRDARDPLTVSIAFKLKAYPVELFDVIDLTIARYGWSAKLFQVIGRRWSAEGQIVLTLKETASSIFTVAASFLPQGYAANTSLPDPWYVPTLGALTITSGTDELLAMSDGTVISRMRVAWPAVDDSAVTSNGNIEVQYRSVASTGEWSRLQVPGDQTEAVIADVQDGNAYTVRARARSSIAVGDWCTQVIHTVVGKTEPPEPFDSFLVLIQPDGTRQYSFAYSGVAPGDWQGAEIRYITGSVGSPTWADMTPLQDSTTFYTASPVELNQPLAGEWTFSCRSRDTSGNLSTALTQTITLTDRRLGSVFAEYYEHSEGWLGTLSGCHVQDGILQADDSTTWATAPATWAAYTQWNYAPTSPITYTTPSRDFGAVVVGGVSSTVDADGSVTTELATSSDGSTWSGWSSASGQFNARYLKLRITVTATGPAPVPVVREWSYQITAPIRSEYINDVVISGLTGSYRIGTGDIRIPLVGTYTVLKKTDVTIQDSSAGSWVATRIDQTLTYGPRWQFRLNGTLTDPSFVDFYVEGY